MSKRMNTSYEGFRRKNRLNSIEINKSNISPDISMIKFNNEEALSEVEQLSMQLDTLRKRPLTSRSFT